MKNSTRKKLFTLMIILIALITTMALLMLSGCKTRVPQKSNFDKAVDFCIAASGVPIISRWSATVDDCIFAPVNP